jgi:hypothetical protein
MWVLCLNDMRASQVEILSPVTRAETREALQALLDREKVEPYKDGPWGKSYRSGGPLEWFNPPWDHDSHRHFINVGTREDAARQAAEQWEAQIMCLPRS